jgi:hypothetical protein
MKPNAAAMPVKTGNIPGLMGGAAPKPVIPPTPDTEKPSLSKVKDLLQQAMDMIGELGANDQVGAGGPPVPPVNPTPRPRMPMKPTKQPMPPPPMA